MLGTRLRRGSALGPASQAATTRLNFHSCLKVAEPLLVLAPGQRSGHARARRLKMILAAVQVGNTGAVATKASQAFFGKCSSNSSQREIVIGCSVGNTNNPHAL